ncbi:hypothetical protein ACOME3_010662 [Neoechinorhynchus agilis]
MPANKSRRRKRVEKTRPSPQGGDCDKILSDCFNVLSLCDNSHAKARTCTGVLASSPKGRDVHINEVCLTFYGNEILSDSNLEFNHGRRYGLVGPSGSGKSSLLAALGNREFCIPEHIDIYYLSREMEALDLSALECVMEVDVERVRLEKESEELAHCCDEESQQRLMDIFERLEELNADKAEARAGRILSGLGFDKEMQRISFFCL